VKINILNRMMVAVVLSAAWLVGMNVPANAQEQQQQEHQQKQDKKQQNKQRPQKAQKKEKKQTKGQMQARQQKGQNKQQQQHAQRQDQNKQQRSRAVANNRGNNGNHYGRISDASYRAHFGNDHSFRMNRPRMVGGYNRFQYSGYSFGFNQPWPVGWSYNDNVYVEYVGGGYYLCNPRYPGVQITLSLF
jgi:hypothetical protein